MRKFKNLGKYLYFVLWPAVWFYAPLRVRVRVLLFVGGEVLVVKNWFGPATWQLPGGGKKIREPVISTAAREVHEEIGISLQIKELKQLTKSPIVVPHHGTLYRFHYVLYMCTSKPQLRISSEITDAQWVSVDSVEIPQMIRSKLRA